MAKSQKGSMKTTTPADKEPAVSRTALVAATFEQYQWLTAGGRINPVTIRKVIFQTFTHDHLKASPDYSPAYDTLMSVGPEKLTNRIFLFDEKGGLIGQVGVKEHPVQEKVLRSKRFPWLGTYTIPAHTELFAESVDDALKRLDSAGNAFFIVGLLEDNRIKGGLEVLEFHMIITTPPKGCKTVSEALEEEMKKAKEELKKHLN